MKWNISKIGELIDSEFTRPRQGREVGPDSRANARGSDPHIKRNPFTGSWN
jgi:hypothetical protein